MKEDKTGIVFGAIVCVGVIFTLYCIQWEATLGILTLQPIIRNIMLVTQGSINMVIGVVCMVAIEDQYNNDKQREGDK
jgi:hypothetical protein